jgi:hypothetical protein
MSQEEEKILAEHAAMKKALGHIADFIERVPEYVIRYSSYDSRYQSIPTDHTFDLSEGWLMRDAVRGVMSNFLKLAKDDGLIFLKRDHEV